MPYSDAYTLIGRWRNVVFRLVLLVLIVASIDAARTLLQALAQGGDAQRHAADAYSGVTDRLLDLLGRHLADEEDLVIPGMLEHGERSLA